MVGRLAIPGLEVAGEGRQSGEGHQGIAGTGIVCTGGTIGVPDSEGMSDFVRDDALELRSGKRRFYGNIRLDDRSELTSVVRMGRGRVIVLPVRETKQRSA